MKQLCIIMLLVTVWTVPETYAIVMVCVMAQLCWRKLQAAYLEKQ